MDTQTFQIRAAAPDDLAAVRLLLNVVHLADNDLAAQFGPQFAVAVTPIDDRVVGVAGVELYSDTHARVGLLRSAAVDPLWRSLGIGRALTDNRLQWAEREGLSGVYLLTETAADYWPRFGFTRIARESAPAPLLASHEWRQGCPASAIAMVRTMLSG